jgi:3-oxoacyl-[acyl-carrier-protein] synthase II
MCAGKDALEDAGLTDLSDEEKERVGVAVGSGIGGLSTIFDTAKTLHEQGPRRVSPFFIPSVICNMAAGNLSIKYGFKGPNITVTTACATSTHSIGEAATMIKLDLADIMLAGGTEAPISPLGLVGFCQARALSTAFNDTPELACRPWDKARDGFIMSEGSGVVVLEEYEHAKARGAKIYAEVSGYGMSSDGYHITAPDPEGKGAIKAMQRAISSAGLNLEDIGYINAHGTSTGAGDIAEATAVKALFANHLDTVSMSSTKSVTGHLLGAAGGVEAIYTVLALQNGILPPTVNLDDVADEAADIDLVPNTPKEKKITHALSNSFGFGGTNATLLFSKV